MSRKGDSPLQIHLAWNVLTGTGGQVMSVLDYFPSWSWILPMQVCYPTTWPQTQFYNRFYGIKDFSKLLLEGCFM